MQKTPISTTLNKGGFPNEEGIYLAKGIWGDMQNEREIEVYYHPIKKLCCFQEDFGSGGTAIDDRYDCQVSVQNTGLVFIMKVRELF